MLNLFRRKSADPSPLFRSEEVQAHLRDVVGEVFAALQRRVAHEVALDLLSEAKKGVDAIDSVREAEIVDAARERMQSPWLPISPLRIAGLLCELIVASADVLDEQDEASIVETLEAFAPLLFGHDNDVGSASLLLARHRQCIAAVLPNGWRRPLVDSPDHRNLGWGLLVGNALTDVTLGDGWRKRQRLSKDAADGVVGRLVTPDRDEPLPPEVPFLPRRNAR